MYKDANSGRRLQAIEAQSQSINGLAKANSGKSTEHVSVPTQRRAPTQGVAPTQRLSEVFPHLPFLSSTKLIRVGPRRIR